MGLLIWIFTWITTWIIVPALMIGTSIAIFVLAHKGAMPWDTSEKERARIDRRYAEVMQKIADLKAKCRE
jgi:hypothetical protein